MESINPATGKTIKAFKEYPSAKTVALIEETQTAFQEWKALSFKERAAKFVKAAAILTRNKNQYAQLMANEMGKPLSQGEGEIEKCAWVCKYYAEESENYLTPEIVKTEAKKSFITYEPLGIVLAVMPWNFPFWQIFRCAAPIMMAGNTIVLKHASNVCGCALAIEEVFADAGFPAGSFRTLLIPSARVGEVITNPYVKAVTLTGGTEAGKNIAALAGGAIKKTVLELGGSDPYIVLKDADIDSAVGACVASRLINGGQSCVSAKRFIVEEAVFAEFTEKFIEKMRNQRMGSPLSNNVTLGPLARHDLREQLHEIVQQSVAAGAKLLLGGVIPEGPGAFYPPTVLINVQRGNPAYEKELFGPVAVVIKAHDEEEAINIANDSVFGLGAAVFSQNIKRAEHIATKMIDAGNCFVNGAVKSDPRLPFGGIKDSGYGRELSGCGIKEFVNIKTVYIY